MPIFPRRRILQPFPSGEFLHNGVNGETLNMNVASRQVMFYGNLWAPGWNSGTKTIVGVRLVVSAKTNGTGSTVRMSLQDMTTTYPFKPDGTRDQEWTGAPADFGTGVQDFTFGSNRSVSPGDLLGFVMEFSVFGSGSAVALRTIAGKEISSDDVGYMSSSDTGATWTRALGNPQIAFICDDASLVYFTGIPFLLTGVNTSSDFQASSTGTGIDGGDERGILWVPRRAHRISAVSTLLRLAGTTSVCDLCVYRGTTLLAARTYDATRNNSTSFYFVATLEFSELDVHPDEEIRLVLKPTTSTVRWLRYSFRDAADLAAYFGGDDLENRISLTNRVDGGPWNAPSTGDASFAPFQVHGYPLVGGPRATTLIGPTRY